MPGVTIFSQSCKGVDDCGICVFVCPEHLLKACRQMNAAGCCPPEISDPAACTGCRNCMIYCPDFAIAVEKYDQDDPSSGDE